MQQGQGNQDLLAPQTRVLNLVFWMSKAYSKPAGQEEIKRNEQALAPPAKQPPKLTYLFCPVLPRWPTYAKLSNWWEKLTCLVFQKARCPAYLQDTLRVLGGSTRQPDGFAHEPTSPELWERGFQSDFHVLGLKFQGRIWTKYAFHVGQFIYLLLMTLYLAAKEI